MVVVWNRVIAVGARDHVLISPVAAISESCSAVSWKKIDLTNHLEAGQERITCLAFVADKHHICIAIGTSHGLLLLAHVPAGSMDSSEAKVSILSRFTLSIRAIDSCKELIVASSNDMTMQIFKRQPSQDEEFELHQRISCQAAVLSVSIDPALLYLVPSPDLDDVWTLYETKQQAYKERAKVAKLGSFDLVAWRSDRRGSILGFIDDNRGIRLIDRSTFVDWTERSLERSNDSLKNLKGIKWCCEGKFLAGIHADSVYWWSISSGKLVHVARNLGNVISVASTADKIVISSLNTTSTAIPNNISDAADNDSRLQTATLSAFSVAENPILSKKDEFSMFSEEDADTGLDDKSEDEHDDKGDETSDDMSVASKEDENELLLRKTRHGKGASHSGSRKDSHRNSPAKRIKISKSTYFSASEEEHKSDYTEQDLDDRATSNPDLLDKYRSRRQASTVKRPRLKPFQPNCTNWSYDSRFLAWNSLGTITCHRGEERPVGLNEDSPKITIMSYSYDIEFHDKSAHRPLRFSDDYLFTMASLGPEGALFASSIEKRQSVDESVSNSGVNIVKSVLHFVPFMQNWATTRQTWTLTLEEDEEVEGVAVGSGRWCYVATSRGWIRTITTSGLQGPILIQPGPIVSMVADCGIFAVMYCTGENNNYTVRLYNDAQGISKYEQATSKGTKLDALNDKNMFGIVNESSLLIPTNKSEDGWGIEWIGFSTNDCEGGTMLGMMGKNQVFSILINNGSSIISRTSQWIVAWSRKIDNINGNAKATGETLWPVTFDLTQIIGVWYNGRQHIEMNGPNVVPKPLISTVPFSIPLLHHQVDPFYEIQEKVLQRRMFSDMMPWTISGGRESQKERRKWQTATDKHILELFQLAIKSDRLPRALDLCRWMYTKKTLDLAVQLARHNRLVQFADRIEELEELLFEPTGPQASHASKENNGLLGTNMEPSNDEVKRTPRGLGTKHVMLQDESPRAILANLTPLRSDDQIAKDEPIAKPSKGALEEDGNESKLPLRTNSLPSAASFNPYNPFIHKTSSCAASSTLKTFGSANKN